MYKALFVLCLAASLPASAGLFGGHLVRSLPANFENPTLETGNESDGRIKTPWIVFSDRVDNYTYTGPGGTLVYKKTAYMQPFYVSDVKGNYLKLIQYDPGLLNGRRIKDKSRAVSFGWISRDRLLLWRKALVDPQTLFPEKAVGVITGRSPIAHPGNFFSGDSIRVFSSPDLQDQVDRELRLHQFVYIYKKSEDGKKYLVGLAPQLTADSAREAVLGWVSTEVVHPWGSRLYLGIARAGDDITDSTAAAFANRAMNVAGPRAPSYPYDPLANRNDPTLRVLPVMQRTTDGFFSSGVAADVFDKAKDVVINIKGTRITYPQYLRLRKLSGQVNVLFVVDGGSSMRNYMPGLTNTIQGFEGVFLQKRFAGYKYRYGAVVYRNPQGCGTTGTLVSYALSPNFGKVVDFLNTQAAVTGQCTGGLYQQPFFKGIQGALDLLKGHELETNLIILCGSAGDDPAIPSSEGYDLVRGLVMTDARLLVLQVYNKFDASFNNFVLQGKDLLEKAAQIQAEQKKLRMVRGEGLAATQQFNTAYTDSMSYYLNYPEGSLIPGAVVFPARGMVKTNREMDAALNRFVGEVDQDNKEIIRTLDSAFRKAGRLRELINPPVEDALVRLDSVPLAPNLGEALPDNGYKFYLDVKAPISLAVKGSPWQYALLLSQEEMLQLSDQLSRLSGDNLEQDKGSFRRQLFHVYVNTGRSLWRHRYSRGTIKSMTLATYLETLSGMPLADPFLKGHTVRDIRGDLSTEEFETLVRYLRACNQALKVQLQMDDFFVANGIPYYYVLYQDWAMENLRKGLPIVPAKKKADKPTYQEDYY
jgi:hypothetical protein